MAKVLAAMAMLPSGATIMVLTICAPFINTDCIAIGDPIFSALRTYCPIHLNSPPSCRRLSIELRKMA